MFFTLVSYYHCILSTLSPSFSHFHSSFLGLSGLSAPFFPNVPIVLFLSPFLPLVLFPASQPAFIFPRLDYCKALPVCQHSWKLFISAPIHLGRQKRQSVEERMTENREGGCQWRANAVLWLWISQPLVVNLHCALHHGLMGRFPAGLLAVCETPTQSWERTSPGTVRYWMCTQTVWLNQKAEEH